MKTVLLTIDGIAPRREILQYALQFCSRIKAELKILQVVDIRRECAEQIGRQSEKGKRYFDRIMMAATFAEANAPEIAAEILDKARENTHRMLTESELPNLEKDVTVRAGSLQKETIRFVRKHRDVVVAILDSPQGTDACGSGEKGGTLFDAIKRRLSVPLVVVRG